MGILSLKIGSKFGLLSNKFNILIRSDPRPPFTYVRSQRDYSFRLVLHPNYDPTLPSQKSHFS